MSNINYTATIQTMGDADDAYAARYVVALQSALKGRFPEAEVEVARNDRASSSAVEASDDVDVEEVRYVANEVWNRAEF